MSGLKGRTVRGELLGYREAEMRCGDRYAIEAVKVVDSQP